MSNAGFYQKIWVILKYLAKIKCGFLINDTTLHVFICKANKVAFVILVFYFEKIQAGLLFLCIIKMSQ